MKHPGRRSNVAQFQHHHGDLGWVILWNTRPIESGGQWSIANEGTEEAAVNRAKHLIRLGFVVHAIKGPSGGVFMDEAAIEERFAPAHVP